MSQINTVSKNKVIVILGPTASGKSDVAIKLAKKFDGEIISADSRQVYRGMDLGTGKIHRDKSSPIFNFQFSPHQDKLEAKILKQNEVYFSEGIPHHLIDVADPNDDFNISHFKKLAEDSIGKILQKGNVPIICGGTGFWIDAIVNDTALPKVAPDKELREKLEKENVEKLFDMLAKIDPERAQNIDSKNKVRLIRAIEICKAIGKVPKMHELQNNKYDFLQIGINVPREILNGKIKKRLEQRFNDGMLTEVGNLNKNSVSWERLEYFGLEYRWIARYLQNKIDFNEMKKKLYFDIIHYAKRQMTWFSRNKKIQWLKDYVEIENAVQKFLG